MMILPKSQSSSGLFIIIFQDQWIGHTHQPMFKLGRYTNKYSSSQEFGIQKSELKKIFNWFKKLQFND